MSQYSEVSSGLTFKKQSNVIAKNFNGIKNTTFAGDSPMAASKIHFLALSNKSNNPYSILVWSESVFPEINTVSRRYCLDVTRNSQN